MGRKSWWTPARRKMYGRQTPNGITCQSCGHDVCQCEPRAATIGEHVDAVLAAKDAEIERLRAEADEWAMRADGVVHNPHCTDDLPCLRCRVEQAERERDEAVALLKEWALNPVEAECAVCHALLQEQRGTPHCEDCIVDDEHVEAFDHAVNARAARLDACLAGGGKGER